MNQAYHIDTSCPDDIENSVSVGFILQGLRKHFEGQGAVVLYATNDECRLHRVPALYPILAVKKRSGISPKLGIFEIADAHTLGVKYGVIRADQKVYE